MLTRTPTIIACATALMLLGSGGPAALAATATTWSVTPGRSFSGSSSKVTFTDTATGSELVCSSSSISGQLRSGSGLAGTHIASITAFSFGPAFSCTIGGGLEDFTLTAGYDFPYYLDAGSYDAANGETTATVTGFVAALTGNTCNAAIWGRAFTTPDAVIGKYTNNTHKLKIITSGSTLHPYHLNPDCAVFLMWNNGDPVTMSGTYTITPAQAIKGS